MLEAHIIARIALALGLGALVGFEREASDQPAGLRTHLTVAIGAALFGVISTEGFLEYQSIRASTNVQIDVTRVASQVVVGIGFIGAGLIFRRGTEVHNLTTAASLWVVAAVGLSCGVGDFGPAVVTTAALLIGLVLLRWPRQLIRRFLRRDTEPLRVVLQRNVSDDEVLAALRALRGVELRGVGIEKEDDALVVVAHAMARPELSLRQELSPIARRDDVRTLRLGSGGEGDG